MKMQAWYIGLVLLLAACGSGSLVPRDFIQPPEMEKILFELNMAEEFVSAYMTKDSTRNKDVEIKKEYHKIYLLHGVNEKKFEESFAYYKQNPDLFRVVMDSLNAKAQRKRNDIYAYPMR